MKKTKQDKSLSNTTHQDLYQAMAQLNNAAEAQDFLTDLCTPAELAAMSDRWRIVPKLSLGIPYRQIHEETGVSITTIGRVARCMSYGTGGYQLIYHRLRGKNAQK